jgi:hypothetical protein
MAVHSTAKADEFSNLRAILDVLRAMAGWDYQFRAKLIAGCCVLIG